MADAAVEFLLNNLQELLRYHSHLITDTKKQIETLEKDLRLFKAFLKDSLKKRRKDERTKVLVHNIRDVVYEVEDVIDAFITQAMEKKSTTAFFKFWKSSVGLHDIGLKVEEVREKVEKARVDFANLQIDDEDKDAKPEECYYSFTGIVEGIQNTGSIWYDSCKKCTTLCPKYFEDTICKKYKEKVVETVPRYRITLNVIQGDYNAHVTMFNDVVAVYVGCPVDEYISSIDQVRPPRRKDVVGFTEVTDELIKRLTKETDYMDVISLIGMLGLGKTTLAWKVFNDPNVLYMFPVRIWVTVSQVFSDKEIFLAILKEFTTVTEEMRQQDDQTIATTVAEYLEKGSFLIVFDDVWSPADWTRLLAALPGHTYEKGKILITSRIEAVGNFASNPRPPKKLRFFTPDESWELLRMEALHKLDCPPQLESAGKLIARSCGGLPLACVIIGGILAAKYAALDMRATERAWAEVSTRVNTYLNENDPAASMKKFISLSYDRLPYHLRACFLYMGVFPEDYEIPASRLIQMWMGEGFIQQSNDYSLEERGDMYLDDLINRNLLTTDKFKPNGKVKTCRIHDALRDFCRTEAGNDNENFLQEIKCNDGHFAPPLSDLHKFRCISIHTNCSEFIKSKPLGHRVRSFVCFSKEEFTLEAENIPDILAAFKLLRVMDVRPIRLTKISSHMYQLVHARYIAMSFDLPTLPSKFSELWNMQTLIVNTTQRKLEVKANLWKLSQLRHFKTNASATLPKPDKNSKYGTELRTLGMISAESCTAELFERAYNLKKLGIRGRLALLLEGKVGSFDSLGKIKFLEKLKLVNDVRPRPASEGRLRGLPQPYQFPSNLKSLTLVSTFLAWNHMSTIGLLENLEVLKLNCKAFVGDLWKAADGGFRRLEFLQIQDTDLAVWEASSHHFPRLRGLVLKNCEKLLGIPEQLADVSTFQMLELYVCKSANASAKKIRDAKRKTQADQGPTFKLSIFPPTE